MPATGSFSMTGLLGGTAGQIDVASLISSLMKAASLPQQQLKDQLTAQTKQLTTYQTINTKLAAMLRAGQNLTDTATWTATSAASSDAAVSATSTSGAPLGTTSFDVLKTAQAQITTIAADGSGNVVATPSSGITVNGTAISLTSGSATDVAAAINAAKAGVTASVVQTDTGQVLQLTSAKTGSAGAFTATGFQSTPNAIVAAQNAQIGVGGAGGYTVSSSTNSFSNVIPGVTFSVSAPATNVSITVTNSSSAIGDAVQGLVTAVNAAMSEINTDTAQGAVFAANASVESINQSVLSTVSQGTSSGASLSTYGIDIDKNGVMSFDSTAFATTYAADPTGTQQAITAFVTAVNTVATNATDPTYGSITTSILQCTGAASKLNQEIGDWNDRLSTIQAQYTTKFTAMETALAKMQSQQTYLTSMFKSMNGNSSSSS